MSDCRKARDFTGITDEMIRPWIGTAKKAAGIHAAKTGRKWAVDDYYSSALVGVADALRTWDARLATSTLEAWITRKCYQAISGGEQVTIGRDRGSKNPRRRPEMPMDFTDGQNEWVSVINPACPHAEKSIRSIDDGEELARIRREMPANLRKVFALTLRGYDATAIAKIIKRHLSRASQLLQALARWLAERAGRPDDWRMIRDAMPKHAGTGHYTRKPNLAAV